MTKPTCGTFDFPIPEEESIPTTNRINYKMDVNDFYDEHQLVLGEGSSSMKKVKRITKKIPSF